MLKDEMFSEPNVSDLEDGPPGEDPLAPLEELLKPAFEYFHEQDKRNYNGSIHLAIENATEESLSEWRALSMKLSYVSSAVENAVIEREAALGTRKPGEVLKTVSSALTATACDLSENKDQLVDFVANANISPHDVGMPRLSGFKEMEDHTISIIRDLGFLIKAFEVRKQECFELEQQQKHQKYLDKLAREQAKEERRKERELKQAAKAAALAELERPVLPEPNVLGKK